MSKLLRFLWHKWYLLLLAASAIIVQCYLQLLLPERMGVIQKIADYYHITKSDIIEGDLQSINSEKLELSAREETLVTNYRQLNEEGKDKADEYIEDLLGMKRVYRAARSADNHPAEITTLTKEEQERIEKAPRVTSENSDL